MTGRDILSKSVLRLDYVSYAQYTQKPTAAGMSDPYDR